MNKKLREFLLTKKKLLLTLCLCILCIATKGLIWFVDKESKEDLKDLDIHITEIEIELDSIRSIKDKIKSHDSINNVWQQIRKYNKFDVSQATLNKLEAGTLSNAGEEKALDSLEKSVEFVENFLDSLSPTYSLEYRKKIDTEFLSLNRHLLNTLSIHKHKNERFISLLDKFNITLDIIVGIILVLLFVSFLCKNDNN